MEKNTLDIGSVIITDKDGIIYMGTYFPNDINQTRVLTAGINIPQRMFRAIIDWYVKKEDIYKISTLTKERDEARKRCEELESSCSAGQRIRLCHKIEELETANAELKKIIENLTESLKLKFGCWLCPECGQGTRSGHLCVSCLEKKIERLQSQSRKVSVEEIRKCIDKNQVGLRIKWVIQDGKENLIKAIHELINGKE